MATAHALPTLEVPTADDMDLHSDDGLYDDGDIELDLEPPPPTHYQDDDVDIDDAASAHEEGAQEIPDEQDDFMVDPEDLIDEDYDDQDGVGIVDQRSISNAGTTQAQTHVQEIDADLIDYSDEELVVNAEYAQSIAQSSPKDVQDDQAEEAIVQQDEIPADMQALLAVDANEPQSPHAYVQSAFTQPIEDQEDEVRLRSPSRQSYHSVGDNEADVQTDGGDGGVLLQGRQEFADEEGDHGDAAYQDHAHHESADDNPHQGQDASRLPSVTVNYEGNELWLFKQHDLDDSGDWLIDDISLAKASMSDLFRACRSSLGDDVSNESEIGFRFDHLHNMELYEDNTACVAVSLERMSTYYHTLLAQDGINEPDSFYISIMIRPRFVTLLSDIAKFADQGSGYAALEAAVAAGETHFSTVVSSASSDEPTEWGNEEQDQEQTNGEDEEQASEEKQEQTHDEQQQQEYVIGEGQQEEHKSEHDHEKRNDAQEDYEGEGAGVHKSEEVAAVHEARQDHGDHSPQIANIEDVTAKDHEAAVQSAEPASQSHTETTPTSEAYRSQPDDDLIDYTDEEEEVLSTVKEAEQTPAHATSPSSVTVRGDESAHAEDQHSAADSSNVVQQEEQDHLTHDEVTIDAEEEPDTRSRLAQPYQDGEAEQPYQDDAAEELYHDDEAGQSYQDNEAEQPYQDDEAEELYPNEELALDEDEPFRGFQADGTEEYPLETQFDGDANQKYVDYDFQDLDEEPELDFMNGDEFNTAGATTTDGNDYAGTEEFLDFDTEWAADQDLGTALHADGTDDAHAEDEEDGAAAQSANAASSAADPTTASSVDANDASPQGQKRSIDEAGHGADIALDSIGMLVYSPSRKRCMGANFFHPDAKRPRV
jgi:hypothetical protein